MVCPAPHIVLLVLKLRMSLWQQMTKSIMWQWLDWGCIHVVLCCQAEGSVGESEFIFCTETQEHETIRVELFFAVWAEHASLCVAVGPNSCAEVTQ